MTNDAQRHTKATEPACTAAPPPPNAGRRSRGLLLIALLATTATGQQDPLSESAFPRLLGISPNGQRIELPAVTAGQTIVSTGFLVDTLKSMRDWRDALRTQCIGPQMDSHATTINDNRVLTDPEWFQDCAQLAAKLANGVGALDKAFEAWNAALGTNYASPRGDPADLNAWAQTRTTMLTFGIACDKASSAIVASGQPRLTGFRARGVCAARTAMSPRMGDAVQAHGNTHWRQRDSPCSALSGRGTRCHRPR